MDERVDLPQTSPASALNHPQFMRLFLQSERELLRYIMALVPNLNDARDILQDTAVALWQAMDKYDPQKPFTPWACRFALNLTRQFLRTEARRNRRFTEEVTELLEQRRAELAPDLDARRSFLSDCLNQLPREQRDLIQGYYFDEESIAHLGAKLQRGSEAIYKALQRIRATLHQCLERKLQPQS